MRSGVRLAIGLSVIILLFVGFAAAAPAGSHGRTERAFAPQPVVVLPNSPPAQPEPPVPSAPAPTPSPTPSPTPDDGRGTNATPAAKTPVANRTEPDSPPREPDGPPQPPTAEKTLAKIPILMYHEIGDKPNNNYVRRSDFAAQMQWLADNGYQGVTVGDVYRHFHQNAAIAKKPVAITFDDGYETFYTTVVPILQEHNFRATSFVITGDVGQPEFMTWAQVTALPKLGMEVGAHTVHHLDLRQLSAERLRTEVLGSRTELEERLGVPVQYFCYPSGQYNQAALDMVKASGYLAAVTTDYGPATPADSPLLWDRVRILRTDTVTAFAEKVRRASVQP